MTDDDTTSETAPPSETDWEALAESAELKVNQAILNLSKLIIAKNRLELLARVATYILFSKTGRQPAGEHAQRSEVNLEYLCSLATALPDLKAADLPSAEDVQATVDHLATIHMHSAVHYTARTKGAEPDDEALVELSKSFQVQKLFVRGDGYWDHLTQTWRSMMQPHDQAFRKAVGFTLDEYLNLSDRQQKLMEDRINLEADHKVAPYRKLLRPWIGELESGNPLSERCTQYFEEHQSQIDAARSVFDAFGSASSYLAEPQNAPEQAILSSLSCAFGENFSFRGEKGRLPFWPLNETMTDKKPFIVHEGRHYAFNFSKIGRSAYEIVSNALREANNKYWGKQFLSQRDDYLEEETARIFRKLFPMGQIISEGFYPLRTGGEVETDVVVAIGDVLLIVECKAGSITPSAKRGGKLRVKTDVGKTVAEGLNQAERLVGELVASGQFTIRGKKEGRITLRADDFRRVFRINVTLDLISSVSSNILSLTDIGLVSSTERCWSVSLNDLRVVVDILDKPALFLHYLIRRFDVDQMRNVDASDELDYMMYYVLQGLFFRGKNKLGEDQHLTISAYTEDLDNYYRRRQGLTDKGAKPRVVLGSHTERFLDLLEKWRPKGWMTASLEFLEFDPPDREKLLGKINWQLGQVLRKKAPFGLSVIGCSETSTAIGLACCEFPDLTKEMVRARCVQRCREFGFRSMVVILVGIPVSGSSPIIFCVSPDQEVSQHEKDLLAQLRFEMTVSRPQSTRAGIFDGLRENLE